MATATSLLPMNDATSADDANIVVEALLKILIEVVKDYCFAETASLLLYDRVHDELYFDVALGEANERLKRVRLSAGQGVAGHVFRTKQAVLATDVDRDQHFSPATDVATGFKTRSIIAVPIGNGSDRDLGVVEAINRRSDPPRFGQVDLDRLVSLQARLGRAVTAAQQIRMGGRAATAEFYRALFEIVAERAGELQQHDRDLAVARRTFDRERAKLFIDEKLAALSRLVAGLAHEINNPLSFVRCNLDTLHSYISELAHAIGAIENGVSESGGDGAAQVARVLDDQRVHETVRDTFALIDESRVGLDRLCQISSRLHTFSGAGPTQVESVDCNELVAAAVHLFDGGTAGRIELQLLAAGLPRVRAVRSRLQAVVLELLDNALRAVDERGRVVIGTSVVDGQVEIAVSDDGGGMTADAQTRVFDPFYTDKGKNWRSTGLGLSAAYGIVVELGGRIEVVSQVGCGSTFVVRLPVSATALAACSGADDRPSDRRGADRR